MSHGRGNLTGVGPHADDRAYCRSVLPRVSRTFALNIRLLGGQMQEAVRVAYLLCRAADAVEDSWPGTAPEVTLRFELLLAGLGGDEAATRALATAAAEVAADREDLSLVAHLPKVLRVLRQLPASQAEVVCEGVRTLTLGMQRYSVRAIERGPLVPHLDDEHELHDYCYVVAGCVGEMLTRLFAQTARLPNSPAQAERLALSPMVGEALQLTNILLDWPSDARRGRCYLPGSWLALHGLEPATLLDPHHHARTHELVLRLEGLAHAALDRVPEYLALIPSRFMRYRLFCLWPALWARASVRAVGRDPQFPFGDRRLKLSRQTLWSEVARSLVAGHSQRGVQWLLRPTSISLEA
ncbi:MAG: squalene/phytoene synthase family protein [Candidatus Eisenbacteria bacterium]